MKLLDGEEDIATSENRQMVLTNYRLGYTSESNGKKEFIMLFLEDVSSVSSTFQRVYAFLVLGLLLIVASVLMASTGDFEVEPLIVGGVGVAFMAWWWFKGKHTLVVSPDGGQSVHIAIEGMSGEDVSEVVFKISEAILHRRKNIRSST